LFDERGLSRIDLEIDHLKARLKGVEDLKVAEDVLDRFTLLTLYDLANKGYIDVLYGVLKTGKESSVFLAKDSSQATYAVKIHRILTSDFKAMVKYIDGDHRFRKVRRSRRSIILTWVEKEYKNLRTAYEAGVKVPMPVVSKNNVLVMEFIGEGVAPSPTLKELGARETRVYRKVVENVRRLYSAGLVHGDISEYNILLKGSEPYLIDLSQAVPMTHPLASQLLERDIRNLSRFFNKKFDKVYAAIVG